MTRKICKMRWLPILMVTALTTMVVLLMSIGGDAVAQQTGFSSVTRAPMPAPRAQFGLTATVGGTASTTKSLFNMFGSASRIYWTDSGSDKVQRANPDGSNVQDLVTTGLFTTVTVAVDSAGGKVYWADAATNKIERANLDGSSREDVVTDADGVLVPFGVAVDSAGGKVYWTQRLSPTDFPLGRIRRANLDGSGAEDLVGVIRPQGIAVDPVGGKVYWVDNGAGNDLSTRKVRRANLDGSDVEDLVTGLSDPKGIALDPAGGKVYWAERNSNIIRRANLDGSGVEDVVTNVDVTGFFFPEQIAVDPVAGKIYWANDFADKIQRANLDGSNVETLVTNGLVQPSGIAIEFSIDPAEAIAELADFVGTLNLSKGVKQALTSKLEAALASLERGQEKAAVNALNAFKNYVNAQNGKKLDAEAADALIAEAEAIIAAIEDG